MAVPAGDGGKEAPFESPVTGASGVLAYIKNQPPMGG